MTPEALLRQASIRFYDNGAGELVAACPAHEERTGKGDKHPSWSVNKFSGQHHCFSCGWGGSLAILAKYLGYAEDDVVPDSPPPTKYRWSGWDRKKWDQPVAQPPAKQAYQPVEWNDFYRVTTLAPRSARVKRGISRAVCEEYDLRVLREERAWAYPILASDNGRLLGWQEKRTGYSRNVPPGVAVNHAVFGLTEARQVSLWEDYLLVLESPLDAARMVTFGFKGSMALFGSNPTLHQVNAIWDVAAGRPVVLLLDDDPAGSKGVDRFVDWSAGHRSRLYVARLRGYGGGDPARLTRREVKEVIEWALQAPSILTRMKHST